LNPSAELTICTSVTGRYVEFLPAWAASIAALTTKPARVIVIGNGLGPRDRLAAPAAVRELDCPRIFFDLRFDNCGTIRNRALAQVETPWAMHLDADDVLLPDALDQVAAVAEGADVVSLGYRQWWPENSHGYQREVVYPVLDGVQALGQVPRIASGCSPFRTALWRQWHYPEQLEAGWDYGLWLGFAHLGARFRPTPRPAFLYRQWTGSHWRMVGQHRHDDLLTLRRALEQDFTAAQSANLGRAA